MKVKRGRPLGRREITLKQIAIILVLAMSGQYTRSEIAKRANVGMFSVWQYTKRFLD